MSTQSLKALCHPTSRVHLLFVMLVLLVWGSGLHAQPICSPPALSTASPANSHYSHRGR
ncbi:MAG: hypothetical protein LW630_10375 [Saprospiraceae bacterium]|nr:hypothetical protein [Saprospiraceae bacterium]